MNWKALLPAAALLVVLSPSAAFSRNHHYYGNISQNGMASQFGYTGYYGGNNFNPMANHGMNPYAMAPVSPPVANFGNMAIAPFPNSGINYVGNNGLTGYNGMYGSCGRHHHKHRRRGLLQALLNQNGYGYGNMGYGGYGNGLGYGNRMGYGGYGNYGNGFFGNSYGYGNGLTGGLRNILNRI